LEPARRETRLLAQLSMGGLLGRFRLGASSLGDFPGISLQRIAILAHQPDTSQIIYGQDSDGSVLELDDPVNARQAVRAEHLVFPDTNPGVFVDESARERLPGIRAIGRACDVFGRTHSCGHPLRAAWRAAPISAGLLATVMPAASSAAI